MEYFFWALSVLIIYTYAGFPLVLILRSRNRREAGGNSRGCLPVTVVCSLHNEESVVAEKIRNFYALDYPDIRLLFGLDGCTDATAARIMQSVQDDRVTFLSFPRVGKAAVINGLLELVTTPLVVMTDANSMFRPDAVKNLVRRLSDRAGVVCGRLILVDKEGKSGENMYWKIETSIKERESRFGSVIGANGAIYLFRRDLFSPLPPGTINDDFSISMKIYEKGYECVYAPDAVAEEKAAPADKGEFERHVRDGAGHYRAMAYLWRLLNPFHRKRFFFYVSHRVLRWLAPFSFITLFVLSCALSGIPLYRKFFYAQMIFYGLLVAVHVTRVRWKPLYALYYFMMVNAALLYGFVRNLFRIQQTVWEPGRR